MKRLSLLLSLFFPVFLFDCGSSPRSLIGGPCTYKTVEGIATIRSVTLVHDQSLYQCKVDPVEIRFDFKANDPNQDFSIPYNPNFYTLGAGMLPPLHWANENGVIVGSQHRVIKMLQDEGSCSPVLYAFPELEKVPFPTSYCF